MKLKAKIFRILSCVLAVILFVETLLPSDLVFAFQNHATAGVIPSFVEKINIPDLARVEWRGSRSLKAPRGFVYLIQDAHTSLEAQKRIARILERLRGQNMLDAVLMEGLSKEPTSKRFERISQLDQRQELLTDLERRGYLHGAAVFALLHPDTYSTGLETSELYRSNFDLFRLIMKSAPDVSRAVSALQVEWQRWLKTHVEKEKYDFFLSSASIHATDTRGQYLSQLINLATRELGIQWSIHDQVQWPFLIRIQRLMELQSQVDTQKARDVWEKLKDIFPAYRTQKEIEIDQKIKKNSVGPVSENEALQFRRFSAELIKNISSRKVSFLDCQPFFDWLALVTLQGEVDPEGLIREIEALEDLLWSKQFELYQDQRAMKLGRFALLLSQAGKLELSREAVRRFYAMIHSEDFQYWVNQILPSQKVFLEDFFEQVFDFYRAAEDREEAFLEKINQAVNQQKMEKSEAPYLAVVMGGYHKNGLTEALQEKGFDVAVITPQLDEIDQDIAYLERMLQPEFNSSTLSLVPAAIVAPGDLPELVGKQVAIGVEESLALVLGRGESRADSSVRVSRRGFLKWFAASASLPIVSKAEDALDQLLQGVTDSPGETPEQGFQEALFPLGQLQMTTSGGMDGYLSGMMSRIGSHLPGMREKWNRVLEETERMRAMSIGITLNYSSSGGLSPGIRARGISGDVLDISGGGASIAIKTIGLLLDELLVNPIRNQADVFALQAADLRYQWKMRQLAGEVAKLLISLKSSETKSEILEKYIRRLTLASEQVGNLVEQGAVAAEQKHAVDSFLNEAKDSKGYLDQDISRTRIALKMLLGEDFNFSGFSTPIPIQKWLRARSSQKEQLVQLAENRLGSILAVRAGQSQTQALEQEVRVQRRKGLFSFIIPRGKANPDKKRQELGLASEDGRISRRPEVAGAQVAVELGEIETRTLRQELKGLVELEAVKFFTAQDSHARWQQQVYEEQLDWTTKGLVAADYDLDRLTLLKRFVQAQIRVIESRGEMSAAVAAWTAAGFEDQSASSQNWMSSVLFSDFFPVGFELPSSKTQQAPKRSELRAVLFAIAKILIVLIVFPFAALGQVIGGQASSLDLPGPTIWKESGQLNMSLIGENDSDFLDLRVPEMVTVNHDGQLHLATEGQLRYEQMRLSFEAELRSYSAMKKGGAKLLELLPRYQALHKKALSLDRSERVRSALDLPNSPDFKVITRQAGTFGENQTSMELVSTHLARIQTHVPLRHLLNATIKVEVAGASGQLIAPPRILEIDAMGPQGNALIDLTVRVDEPIDLGGEIAYAIQLEQAQDVLPVSHGEPVQIFTQDQSGNEISIGVAQLEREAVPVLVSDFGVPQFVSGIEAGVVSEQTHIAKIPFEREALIGFLRQEAASLSQTAKQVLPQAQSSGAFSSEQMRALEDAAILEESIAAQIDAERDLVAPASGALEMSADFAAGFPMNEGDTAAWIRTSRVLIKTPVLSGVAKLSEGDEAFVKLADGRTFPAKVLSVGTARTGYLSGRNEVLIEADIPLSSAELDWGSFAEQPQFSAPFLYELLARAHQVANQSSLPQSVELSGSVGMGALIVPGTGKTVPVVSLAELIGSDSDPVRAHHHFKIHRGQFSSGDYRPLLESMHLSLAHDAAKFLIYEEGEWTQVLHALDQARKNGDLGRARALYDAAVSALLSQDKKVEEGLAKLGLLSRSDSGLRVIANNFFATMMVERGLNDFAVRRALDSDLWTLPEITQFAFSLKNSSEPQIQKLAGGVFEWIWRSLASGQIQTISNSAYRKALLSGRNPEHALTWLDKSDLIREFVYRDALLTDRALLRDGPLSGEDTFPPAVSALIDGNTADQVAVPDVRNIAPASLIPGVVGEPPITLGEFDILSNPAEQDRFLRETAAKGDYETLTWVLSSQVSSSLKKTAISLLKDSEQGTLLFAAWFAWYADDVNAAWALENYGVDLFWAEILSEIESLDRFHSEEQKQPSGFSQASSAPKREAFFNALSRLLQNYPKVIGADKGSAGVKLLLMLVNDPADLGRLARGEKPYSVESRMIAEMKSSHLKKLAEVELMRRSLLTALRQLQDWNQHDTVIGESRMGVTTDQIRALQDRLSASSFSSEPHFGFLPQTASPEEKIKDFVYHSIAHTEHAEKISSLAQAHFQAGWTGTVENPALNGRNAGLFWTGVTYLKNAIGIFILGLFSWAFFQQFRIRSKKKQIMWQGKAVQFYDDVELWLKDFENEILSPGFISQNESKRMVALQMKEWGDELLSSSADYRRLLSLSQSVFSWPNFGMRLQNFQGFRNDDRKRDRIMIYALVSLSLLTLKHLSEQSEITPDQEELYQFLKGRSHRLIVFSYVLFQLKNLKENESYNAVRPKISNPAIQKLREKFFRFQARVWPFVRAVYALNLASKKIRGSLEELVQSYDDLSRQLGDQGNKDIPEIIRIIQTPYSPREAWGTSPDNAGVAIDRKLATRTFNFIGALGSIPAIVIQVVLGVFLLLGTGATASFGTVAVIYFFNAVLLYSSFTFLSHIYANLANLHDVQAEEFMEHLSRIDSLMEYKPHVEQEKISLMEEIFLPEEDFEQDYRLVQKEVVAPPVKVPRQSSLPLITHDVISKELLNLSDPGFDGILIAHDFPRGVSPRQRAAIEKNYRELIELYGIRVPVQFIDVNRVENGNGFPALSSMVAEAQFRKMIGQSIQNPKIVVLEAYGPPYDPARLMAGSTFFSSTGRTDALNRPITTGVLALARASMMLREMEEGAHTLRMKTDTLSLHRFAPHLNGEINFASALLPAKKAARLGVPLFKKEDPTRLYGFIEKGAKAFRHLYAQKQGISVDQIHDDTLIPVFTGDVIIHFSAERQKVFDGLVMQTREKWSAILKEHPDFEFDEVLDFWVPLIIASNGTQSKGALDALRLYVNYRAGVTHSGLPITQEKNVERHAVYMNLFTQLFQQASSLSFQIHGHTDEKAAFRDIRKLKDLVKSLHEAAQEKSPTVRSVGVGRAVTIGLNGASPQTALKKGHAFMIAVPYRGTQATVYGLMSSFSSGRPEAVNFGIPYKKILGRGGVPLFLEDIQFDELPIFPVGEPNRRLNEALITLLDGGKIKFNVDSADDLRRSGYVSLRELAEGYDAELGGIHAPAFQHPFMVASAKRSELRVSEAVVPEVLKNVQVGDVPMISELSLYERPQVSIGRSEQRSLVQLVRDGVITSAVVIFRGILPKETLPGVVLLAAQYATKTIRVALAADYLRAISSLQDSLPAIEASPHQVLFVEGKLFSNRALLENLEDLAKAPFKIELLFTRSEEDQYKRVIRILRGVEKGSLKIRLGTTISEMIHDSTYAAVLENAQRKNSFAFLGTESSGARRIRSTVANLMVIQDSQAVAPALLLDALMSPAIFSLNFRPNRIWTFDSALPMLLAARQFSLSA